MGRTKERKVGMNRPRWLLQIANTATRNSPKFFWKSTCRTARRRRKRSKSREKRIRKNDRFLFNTIDTILKIIKTFSLRTGLRSISSEILPPPATLLPISTFPPPVVSGKTSVAQSSDPSQPLIWLCWWLVLPYPFRCGIAHSLCPKLKNFPFAGCYLRHFW